MHRYVIYIFFNVNQDSISLSTINVYIISYPFISQSLIDLMVTSCFSGSQQLKFSNETLEVYEEIYWNHIGFLAQKRGIFWHSFNFSIDL